MLGKLCGIHIITYVMEVNNQLENKSQQPKLKVAMVGRQFRINTITHNRYMYLYLYAGRNSYFLPDVSNIFF